MNRKTILWVTAAKPLLTSLAKPFESGCSDVGIQQRKEEKVRYQQRVYLEMLKAEVD